MTKYTLLFLWLSIVFSVRESQAQCSPPITAQVSLEKFCNSMGIFIEAPQVNLPYTIEISDGSSIFYQDTSNDAFYSGFVFEPNIVVGTTSLDVTIVDASSCTYTENISYDPEFFNFSVQATAGQCNQANDGVATISPTLVAINSATGVEASLFLDNGNDDLVASQSFPNYANETISFSGLAAGDYYVNLTSPNSDCFSEYFFTIDPDQTVNIQISLDNMSSIASVLPNQGSYQWINCDTGQDVVGATNNSYTLPDNANYKVRIETSSCFQDSDCVTMDPQLSTPEYALKNASKFTIAINQTAKSLQLESEKNTLIDFKLYDIGGKILLAQNKYPSSEPVSIADLDKGIYIVSIIHNNSINTYKIVI